ncbi:hypothetical protein [Paenibacillus beijingensis]|uniref:hypothetical protein n=1 Tax=Paenibacillus beijingensis TaxID=1126833 RepID=UPI00130DBAE8|nr:hypothetical protein [Paenibacillus beijingensis]
MKTKIILIALILCLCCGCASKNEHVVNNKFTKFTGELLSVVKQKGNSFTVTVIKVSP